MKGISTEAKNLYSDRFLQFIRVAATDDGDVFFFRSQCAAEMRKRVRYNIDVKLNADSSIECQCDCAVGLGPSAHCKHVVCVLAVAEFQKGNPITLFESCTQQLQNFHKPRAKYQFSPMKAVALSLSKQRTKIKLSEYDPLPQLFRQDAAYPSYFRNQCLNFSYRSPRMSVLQLYAPANLVAYHHNHDYFSVSPDYMCLRDLNLVEVSREKAVEIESKTKQNSMKTAWRSERCHHLTSSAFGKICKSKLENGSKLAKTLLNPVSFSAAAVNHGLKYEQAALRQYSALTGNDIEECGLFVSPDTPFLAATPDGITVNGIVVEVKCPFVAKDKNISDVTVPYLKEEYGHLTLDKRHDYYYLVQGQLYCTGRQQCDFCVFTLVDFMVCSIERDSDFINAMLLKLDSFYNNYFKAEVIEKFLYKCSSHHAAIASMV